MSVEQVVKRIRPAVRDQHAYLVGGIDEPLVKLNQNESPFDLPPELKEEVLRAFADIPFNRYPEEQSGPLVRAYADYAGCSAGAVLVGNGSNELTYTLGLTLLERGTPVVLPRPMFSLYEKVVRMHDGDLVDVPSREDFSFDSEGLLRAVSEHQPVLTVLTTPNNPTGLAMQIDEIEAIAAASGGFVVVDEAYVEFSDQPSALASMAKHPNLILLRTLSKACGLAGLRIGFMLAHPKVISEILKVRPPFMVDPLAAAAARSVLRHRALLADRARRLKAGRSMLVRVLSELDEIEVVPSQANFVIFRTPMEPAAMMGRLAEAGVLVRNMGGYPELRGFLRVNAGTDAENNAFLIALKNALAHRR